MINTEPCKKGEMTLKCRREMSICGVEEVISFDDMGVHLLTVDGELYVEGKDIKIDTLDTEVGRVELIGRINGFYYAKDPDEHKKGFLARLTR